MVLLTTKKYKTIDRDIAKIRQEIVNVCFNAKSGHIVSSLSCVEMIYAINYFYEGDDKKFDFILSKGHAAPALYAILEKFKKINKEDLYSFCKFKSNLTAHVSWHVPGVQFSSGALGLGLSVGVGFCLANKINKKKKNVYVLIGDGELNEGSVWEALVYAGINKIENLICLVDYNKIQASNYTKNIIDTEKTIDSIRKLGWCVFRCEGHNIKSILTLIKKTIFKKSPIIIFFDTIKGRGVSFMEDDPSWHYKVLNKDDYMQAIKELNYEL